MTAIKKTFQYGDHSVTLETGEIARQADGAVLVSMGQTSVLVTVVGLRDAKVGQDFFPLTVHYQERFYAAGRIPGGYFKREGRPTEKETLTSRLIDRPIRPLFPEGFLNEVQIIATVMSSDPEIDADIPAMIGASAALALSGIPFNGPIGAARVGYINGDYVLNPSAKMLEQSRLDMVVAGTEKAVLMVESEAKVLAEEIMLGAVTFAHRQMQTAIQAIRELAAIAGKPRWVWTAPAANVSLEQAVVQVAEPLLSAAYQERDKLARQVAVKAAKAQALEKLVSAEGAVFAAAEVKMACERLESRLLRERVLNTGIRIDGRDTKTIRPIKVRVGVLPRTHGSALFTRGETQALVVVTLGTGRDAQTIDALEGEARDEFMLHYNFPPYCVGETGAMTGPKRREVGHGRLAKRGVIGVLPPSTDFPYVIRVVSEITESNGSSSMASVCGTSLALMDAGVPVKAPVSGIAMGLIKEGDRYTVLSDIIGDEDHFGDMDFKVAGTAQGITALQMDIKIDGITEEIMRVALSQAQEGRLHILSVMNQTMNLPRQDVSDFAPRITTIKIPVDKIREVIGKGGATIRAITEETGTSIDIADDGTISIAAVDNTASQAAVAWIQRLTAEVEVGQVYDGRVIKITDFGAFVEVLPGKEGLLHISQICERRLNSVTEVLQEGETVRVKVIEIDRQGRVRLSKRALEETA